MAPKRKPIPNKDIIEKLTKAGLVPETRYSNLISTYYIYHQQRSYRIPLDIYTKVIGKRFTTKFKISDVVRIRSGTTRYNRRSHLGQDVGDIYKWGHLGIGSGKNYAPSDLKPIRGYLGSTYNVQPVKNPLTIGQEYIMNVTQAIALEKKFVEMGYKVNTHNTWTRPVRADEFFETVILKPTGLFGPKKLINGVVTDVYVHFLYPKWEFKREARYKVVFETGAHGIFTGDMLDRVFDTDFDVDEKLMARCKCQQCNMHSNCDHTKIHIYDNECDDVCPISGLACTSVYDYTQLCETTIQRGLIDEDEEK